MPSLQQALGGAGYKPAREVPRSPKKATCGFCGTQVRTAQLRTQHAKDCKERRPNG
jgi:hypothetical protein